MKITRYISKQFTTRRRDWLIATLQAAATAAGTFIVDQLSISGLQFDFKQILTASAVVFGQHILRKLLESDKLITMQKLDKDDLPIVEEIVNEANAEGAQDPPPNNNDPTHPSIPPVKP